MINIDKVIDEYNETLEERITKEQLRHQFESKLKEGTKNDSTTISTGDSNINFYQVLDEDGNPPEIPSSTLTTVSAYIEDYPVIKEQDQTRIIKFNKGELLSALGFTNLVSPENEEVELKVIVVGRDCNKYGHPINID